MFTEVHPTLSEWDALPYLLQQAVALVRFWERELEADAYRRAQEKAGAQGARRG